MSNTSILKTNDSVAALVARLALGITIFPHGAQKVLGWFGGYGFSGTLGYFTGQLHIPAVFAILAFAAEFLGGIALILGLFGRVAAFGVASVMVVAVYIVHWHNGFFMNWNVAAGKGEGFEYHILAVALALVVMILGSGAASLDSRIAKS